MFNLTPAVLYGGLFHFCNKCSKIYLVSRKVEKYICGMKTIKIDDNVHRNLKIYCAQVEDGDNMSSYVGFAIMKFLEEQGHKWVKPKNKSSNNKK